MYMNDSTVTSSYLPSFSSISPENIFKEVENIIKLSQLAIEKIASQSEFTWENLCQPLEDIENNLHRTWSPISHLNSVRNSKELREPYEKSLLLLSKYSSWVGHNKQLYQAYKKLRNSQSYINLSISQKKVINNVLRDFELSGIKLSLDEKAHYTKLVSRLSELRLSYNNNVLDATMNWEQLITDEKILAGIPKNILSIMYSNARIRNKNGWLLTLDAPIYSAVLTYCENESIREDIYYAYHTRASDKGINPTKWDNSSIMKEILDIRHKLANLLGFKNYASRSLIEKMEKNPDNVIKFLTNLVEKVRCKGKEEFRQLSSFAREMYGCNELKSWDIAFYSEKQKKYLYCVDEEIIRFYFPISKVLNGLFEIIKRVFGISVVERHNVDVWHSDVRFFDFIDNKNCQIRGSMYLDLYIRANKRSGAWMDTCLSMMRKSDGSIQRPVAYIVCNFTPPIGNTPSLLTHKEVVTLFHEFGHGLHHILTKIDTYGVSGINGVPLDAIEVPSQFMENYCWVNKSLSLISEHYKNKNSLPDKILNSLIQSKNYQIGLFLLRQIEFSLFDFQIHCNNSHNRDDFILDVLEEIRKKVSVIPRMKWERFPHTFSHIFSNGYSAGYYSYLWSNVLSIDIWSIFEKEDIFSERLGKLFLDNILSKGGSEDLMKLFVNFLKREPNMHSMLRHYGIL